jgi:bacteriorhodopsin
MMCVMMCGGCGVQVVAYTILDIISKVVFSFMIVSAHDSLGSTSPQTVQSREYV